MKRIICTAMLLAVLLSTFSALASTSSSHKIAEVQAMPMAHSLAPALTSSIPPNAGPEEIANTLAGLSDERVRTLLMKELRAKAAVQPVETTSSSRIADFAHSAQDAFIQAKLRFHQLFFENANVKHEVPNDLRFALSTHGFSPEEAAINLCILTLAWGICTLLYRKRTKHIRDQIACTPDHASWTLKAGRLGLRSFIDILGFFLSAGIAMAFLVFLITENDSARPILFSWLTAVAFFELSSMVTRFLLAPQAQSLRFFPLTDTSARHIYRFSLWIFALAAFGLMLETLIRLVGGNDLLAISFLLVVGNIILMSIGVMVLWNKNRVKQHLLSTARPDSWQTQFASMWHVMALAYLFIIWAGWLFGILLIDVEAVVPATMSILAIPFYFFMNYVLQSLVSFATNLSDTHPEIESDEGMKSNRTRYLNLIRFGFRILLLTAILFGLSEAWGMEFSFGETVAEVGLDAMITLTIAYIVWSFTSSAIERHCSANSEVDDEGDGEGGPGGDRVHTLMQLLKKFLFIGLLIVTVLIILSSTGMDIGPLLASASVVGLAIGFGAQTLVKDIISGIFFLMDDAFRVGDYIETAGAMGTVEEISVRSLKLRHHLGFLYTIPFGSMKLVKNNTRDWSIMKLQYLVPFDTDIQQVKKIIKKINKEVRAIPELNDVMLSDIKSQGVKAMEEYGMRMRVKFMTKPGGQFTLRKLILAKMRKHFAEQGIEFAKPRVSVHIPDGKELTDEERNAIASAAFKQVDADKKATAIPTASK